VNATWCYGVIGGSAACRGGESGKVGGEKRTRSEATIKAASEDSESSELLDDVLHNTLTPSTRRLATRPALRFSHCRSSG